MILVAVAKPGAVVLDVIYIVGSVAFFAIMLLYVRACAALGRRGEADGEQKP